MGTEFLPHPQPLAPEAMYRLLAWCSPSYPTGAFSYSHGLEWAIEEGSVRRVADLVDYISAVLERGGAWIDAVLFAHVYRAAVAKAGFSYLVANPVAPVVLTPPAGSGTTATTTTTTPPAG